MSMTSLSFRCNKCDFAASSMVNWGSFNYKHENKLLSVNRKLGWCEHCATICPIEVLATTSTVDQAIAKQKQLIETFECANESLLKQRSFIAKMLRLRPAQPFTILSLKNEIDYLNDIINEMRELLSFFSNRHSGPRCLLCGCERVVLLPSFEDPDETDDHEEEKFVYVLNHPTCGGAINVYHPSIRFSMKMRERFYDVEGIEMESDKLNDQQL